MYQISLFAPLMGFLIVGLFGRQLGDRISQMITTSLIGIAAVISVAILHDTVVNDLTVVVPLFSWIGVNDLQINWAIKWDTLSALMFVVVNSTSFLVHIYSIGYMHHDPGIPRFMAYLSFFTFMMLALVSADNLLQLFFGWEGVGVASYLLIGFWYHKDSACAASIKAFVVNRVADLGLIMGIALLFFIFDTLDLSTILVRIPDFKDHTFSLLGYEWRLLEVVAFFLFIGAMGKSAQLGLHTWLADAMEGPTPVSALIHAATMVTAGVYLVCRLSILYEYAPYAKAFMMIVGASTALFAGTIAITQHDIKRVIAYSTCSQLGYMFFAAGAGGYSAAMFHLLTHAQFKALLFLGAGSVIHALSDEQDLRRMGGLWCKLPKTYMLMWVGTLALTGMPIFAGYYSKELILSSTWLAPGFSGNYALWIGIGSTFLTSFYSLRLLWLVFHGRPRADETTMKHVHEAPLTMMIPMGILAIASLASGIVPHTWGWFDANPEAFWHGAVMIPLSEDMFKSVPGFLPIIAKIVGISGIILGILFYSRLTDVPGRIVEKTRSIYQFFYGQWYFDKLYQWLFINKALKIGSLFWVRGDQKLIDQYGPDGVARLAQRLAHRTTQLQTGSIPHYAFAMISGVAFLTFLYLILR